jgi:hypothetical protein
VTQEAVTQESGGRDRPADRRQRDAHFTGYSFPVIRKRAVRKSCETGVRQCAPAGARACSCRPAHAAPPIPPRPYRSAHTAQLLPLSSYRSAHPELLAPLRSRPAAAGSRSAAVRAVAVIGGALPQQAGAAAGISRRCRCHQPPLPPAGCPGRCRGPGSVPFLGIGMCVPHLRVNHSLHRIPDSGALAGDAGPGQCKLANDCRFGVPGRCIHAMTREPTKPDQWTSYRPCTGTL